jgi:hypothetical protein
MFPPVRKCKGIARDDRHIASSVPLTCTAKSGHFQGFDAAPINLAGHADL